MGKERGTDRSVEHGGRSALALDRRRSDRSRRTLAARLGGGKKKKRITRKAKETVQVTKPWKSR